MLMIKICGMTLLRIRLVMLSALYLIALQFIVVTPAFAADRMALVIGNSAYPAFDNLKNPVNDSSDIAAELEDLGYEVTLVSNIGRSDLIAVLRDFRNLSLGSKQAVIYYAGHGIEIGKRNYLVPTDAKLESDLDIEYEAVALDLVVGAVSGAQELSLVILDACRNNPFLQTMTRSVQTRSIGRGLAQVEPTGNTLIAYAARHGTVASDGNGRNSPFAEALIRALRSPGLEVGKLFRQIRDDVMEATSSRQEPFIYGSLSAEDIYINPHSEEENPDAPDATAQTFSGSADKQSNVLALDLAFWDAIKSSKTAMDFDDYLNRFPNGTFRPLAERRLAALAAPNEAAKHAREEVAAPKPSEPELTIEVNRAIVREVQERLNVLNLGAGGVDGLMGNRTRSAIRKFQSAQGLPLSGEIDVTLLNALRSEVDDAKLAAYRKRVAQEVAEKRAVQAAAYKSVAQAAPKRVKGASAYDGTYIGTMKCELFSTDWGGPDFGSAEGRIIRFDVVNGKGIYGRGPAVKRTKWTSGTPYERWDISINEQGKVRSVGEDQFRETPGSTVLYMNPSLFQGVATENGLKMKGKRGPRRCSIELSRL